MTSPGPADGPPDVAKVRKWTGASVSSIDDDQLSAVLDAEVTDQAAACLVAPYNASLYQAVLRRCARELAARGVPLGMTSGDAEYGPTRLASFDAEIERLEGRWRRVVFG